MAVWFKVYENGIAAKMAKNYLLQKAKDRGIFCLNVGHVGIAPAKPSLFQGREA